MIRRRKLADDLGGFRDGWSHILTDVVEEVCNLGADPETLADHLGVKLGDLPGNPKTDVGKQIVRKVLLIWLNREDPKATLEVLFTVLERMELLKPLTAKLKEPGMHT